MTRWGAAPVAVATITVAPQSFAAADQMTQCEATSFDPWHALAEQRPLGGINRARMAVYRSQRQAPSRRDTATAGVASSYGSLSCGRYSGFDCGVDSREGGDFHRWGTGLACASKTRPSPVQISPLIPAPPPRKPPSRFHSATDKSKRL